MGKYFDKERFLEELENRPHNILIDMVEEYRDLAEQLGNQWQKYEKAFRFVSTMYINQVYPDLPKETKRRLGNNLMSMVLAIINVNEEDEDD